MAFKQIGWALNLLLRGLVTWGEMLRCPAVLPRCLLPSENMQGDNPAYILSKRPQSVCATQSEKQSTDLVGKSRYVMMLSSAVHLIHLQSTVRRQTRRPTDVNRCSRGTWNVVSRMRSGAPWVNLRWVNG